MDRQFYSVVIQNNMRVTFPRNVGLCSWLAERLRSGEPLPGAHLPGKLCHAAAPHIPSSVRRGPAFLITSPGMGHLSIPVSIHRRLLFPPSWLRTHIQLVYVLLHSVLDSFPGLQSVSRYLFIYFLSRLHAQCGAQRRA